MKRLFPYLPPLILCLVAFLHFYLVRTHGLTPWKGGGFGMFSTNDHEARLIEVWVADAQGERRVEVASAQRSTPLTAMPSEERMAAMGRRVAESERSRGVGVHQVRVAAWRTDFVAPAMSPQRVLIREVVINVGNSASSH